MEQNEYLVPVGTGAQTIACSLLQYPYVSGDNVYTLITAATSQVIPANPLTQSWSTNGDYSGAIEVGPARYILLVTNTDGTRGSQ